MSSKNEYDERIIKLSKRFITALLRNDVARKYMVGFKKLKFYIATLSNFYYFVRGI